MNFWNRHPDERYYQQFALVPDSENVCIPIDEVRKEAALRGDYEVTNDLCIMLDVINDALEVASERALSL